MKLLKIISLTVFFVLAGTIFTHSLGSINQDIGRHLKIGEIIWDTHHIPKINLFSYTEPNAPFINHHWLSEVVFYLLSIWIGLKGLIIFKAGILLTALFLLWRAVAQRVEPLSFVIASLGGLLIILDRTDVRPEIFSYLFLAYFLFAIFKSKYSQENTWLYSLPLIQIFWTNMHIYFALGPVLLLLYLIDRFFENIRNSKSEAVDRKQYVNLKIILGLTLLATLINPYGIYGAIAPFTILNSYGYSIVENQSILFLKNYGILLIQINIFLLGTILFWLSYIP